MIKHKLSPDFQPSSFGVLPNGEFEFEIFTKPSEGPLVTEKKEYDRNHPAVMEFYRLFTTLMAGYVKPGEDWDLVQVMENPAKNADENIVISTPEGEIAAVCSIEKMIFQELSVVDLNGLIVSPQLRGSGIASWVITDIAERLNPAIFSGSTNSEIAAASTAVIVKKKGYTTFIGGKLIADATEISHADLADTETIQRAWLKHLGYSTENQDVYIRRAAYPKFKKADRANREKLGLSGTELANLIAVFDEIIQQQLAHSDALVQAPLVSVKI
jgi:hypothetical protein